MNETLLLQKGRAFLALQPFSVLIGAELHALSPGHCELQVPVTGQILQQNGFVHGAAAQGTINLLPARDASKYSFGSHPVP